MKRIISFLMIAVLAGCHNNSTAPMAQADSTRTDSATTARLALKTLHYDYEKDPACGMPLKAGLEDTTTYKGKLYGFCSKECKEAFLKEPATYLAQIK